MNFPSSEERFWLPVHTLPRCEKKFIRFCESYDITSYLPLKIKVRTKGRGTVRTELPMFPGYAFAWVNPIERTKLAQTSTIVNFIALDREQEASLIENLESVLILERMQENEEIVVSPEIQPGSEVKVSAGPLRGLNGLVTKRKGIHRVVVNVEMISRSISMELDSADVELEH
ncbi:MAG: hypothetical protein NE330_02230 [Lentisphaeraceae bacterium]|nr:hypothetical protein [Lentisphaeraceae bacterium]